MKDYFNRMKQERSAHERRQWSLRAAGVVTVVIFLGWTATLGMRFATPGNTNADDIAQNGGFDIQSQLASVVSGIFPSKQNTLEVATTTSMYKN